MQGCNTVVVMPGDKLLICLAEEPTEEDWDHLKTQVEGHFEGVVVGLMAGVSAVVVHRPEAGE